MMNNKALNLINKYKTNRNKTQINPIKCKQNYKQIKINFIEMPTIQTI